MVKYRSPFGLVGYPLAVFDDQGLAVGVEVPDELADVDFR
jgi:hypothetical protein